MSIANSFNSEYGVGDEVFHATPDGDKGIVLDVRYSVRTNQIQYEVAFGRRSEDTVLCYDDELSESKRF